MGIEVIEDSEEGKGKKNEAKSVVPTQEDIDAIVERKLSEALAKMQASQQSATPQSSLDPEAFASMISRGISEGMKTKTGQFQFDEGFTESEIDLDDLLEEKDWVTFAVHKIYDVIVGDKRHGKQIRVPYEPIKFLIQASKIVKNGKSSSITNFATYTCKSKIELDWLRNHSQYNIRFFDSINGAASVEAKEATVLSKNMNLLNSMNQHQIFKYAKDHDVAVTSDLNIMKAELATKLTKKELGQFKHWQKDAFKEQMEEAEKIGQTFGSPTGN
jgi:hypothetical protein